ncbi:MAG: uroporphyrinogen-III C-methyltransferase [Lonepinella koalarum]|nr:uroporphyrinogen-III C-methyltransferase [Lonepinella koalarum]
MSDTKIPSEQTEQESTQAEAQTQTEQDIGQEQAVVVEPTPIQTPTPTIIKKSGTALSLLALLVALGLGGVSYYFAQLEVDKIQEKFTALERKIEQKTAVELPPLPNFDQEIKQIAQLESRFQGVEQKLPEIDRTLVVIAHHQNQLNDAIVKVSEQASAAQPNDWLLSEANFLLTNALRKLMLDNDIETAISLLKVADEALSKVSDTKVSPIRAAINQDLKQLWAVNTVDQNDVMQRLSELANNIDELSALNVDFGNTQADEKVSDDVTDWKSNLKKTANSFLNNFVRITPRNKETSKALLAPNQDIYLRENIRLRLQIAILAVPRQQNELYKQSLEAVAAWVRSYFDTSTDLAANFLKNIDELAEKSIYVNVPDQLTSLNLLDKLLNRQPVEVKKVEIEADKTLVQENKEAVEEIKSDAEKANTEKIEQTEKKIQ